jgi:hypothetical protein
MSPADAHDARWQNARRLAELRRLSPAWWVARMLAAGRKPPCRVCGFVYRSRTTGGCGWCGCEDPAPRELPELGGHASQRARRAAATRRMLGC